MKEMETYRKVKTVYDVNNNNDNTYLFHMWVTQSDGQLTAILENKYGKIEHHMAQTIQFVDTKNYMKNE